MIDCGVTLQTDSKMVSFPVSADSGRPLELFYPDCSTPAGSGEFVLSLRKLLRAIYDTDFRGSYGRHKYAANLKKARCFLSPCQWRGEVVTRKNQMRDNAKAKSLPSIVLWLVLAKRNLFSYLTAD